MSRRGSYGAYIGILKKAKYKIKISDIKRVGYLKDFGIKNISSYPVADDPLNIVIETNNNKYFIPYKQFTKKQMEKMYEEINKRNRK